MAKQFKDLTADQRDRFQAKCKQLGIDSSKVPESITTDVSPDGIKVGHPSVSSHFAPAKVIDVPHVRALNELGGCKDEEYKNKMASDAFVRYPKPITQLNAPRLGDCQGDVCKLKDSLSIEHHEEINKALNAAVMGDSSKVLPDYEEHINAIHFPMKVSVHAAQDLVITKDKPLIVDNPDGSPTQLVFGTVTVEEGGYILAKTPLNLESQVFTVKG